MQNTLLKGYEDRKWTEGNLADVDPGRYLQPFLINRFDFSLKARTSNSLLLLDLDNTITDTRRWFADCILDLTAELALALGEEHSLINEVFAQVATATTLHEYAYMVEVIAHRLESHKKVSFKYLRNISQLFWMRFLEHHQRIELYHGVIETLVEIRVRYPALKIVILTDSPEWIALERLALVGVLPLVDGVVAIRSEAPNLKHTGYRSGIKVVKERLEFMQSRLKRSHLKLNLAVPASFAKPSAAGIELITKRLGVSSAELIIVGDKDGKEGLAAANWRRYKSIVSGGNPAIHFVRAEYGNHDIADSRYSHLSKQIRSLKAPTAAVIPEIPLRRSINKFAEILDTVDEVFSCRAETIQL
ncbi:hypothetical protein BH10CYA1_BH10CYA1_48210 [soil metagenome]